MKNSLRKGLVRFTTALINKRTNFKLDSKITPGCFKLVDKKNKAGKFSVICALTTDAQMIISRTKDLGSHSDPSTQKKIDFVLDKILFAIVNEKNNVEYQTLLRDLEIAQVIPQVYFTDKKISGDLGPLEFQKIQKRLSGLALNLQSVKDFKDKLSIRKTLVEAFEVIDCHAPKGSSNRETNFRVGKVTDHKTPSIDFEFIDAKKWEQCGIKMFSILQMYSSSFVIDKNARKIIFHFPEHDLQNYNDKVGTNGSAAADTSNGTVPALVVQSAPTPVAKKDPNGDRILAMVSDMEGLPEDMLKVIHMLVESFSIQVRLVKEEKNKLAARLADLKTVDEFWTLLKKNDLHVIKGQKHEIVGDRVLFTVLTEELKPLDKEQLQGYVNK